MRSRAHCTAAICLLHSAFCLGLSAQPTNFSYQGVLNESGSPANGIYDFQFAIYNGPDSGAPGISALQSSEVADVPVSNGLFTAEIPFAAWVFNGEQRWLEVQVRTNDSGDYTALLPWTEITPAPYAVRALNVTSNALLGDYGEAVSFSNPSNTFVGDGSGLSGVTLDGATAEDFWQLGGNAGTAAGANFIGTIDNQALELKVNNTRALRIETTGATPNLIGGNNGNSVGGGVEGAIISGGGSGVGPHSIEANADYSTIGGGEDNIIDDNAQHATISGGRSQRIGSDSVRSTIGGGRNNTVASNAWTATIAGGELNDIDSYSDGSVVGGGYDNNIASESWSATIAGGELNDIGAVARHGAIGGGYGNGISSYAAFATIAGGSSNEVGMAAVYSAIGGGQANAIRADSPSATIAGGEINDVGLNAVGSVIGGGRRNTVADSATTATIAGGWFNDVGMEASESAIGGGYDNNIGTGSAATVIAGGDLNDIGVEADWSVIGGGEDNNIDDNAQHATIAGGRLNDIGAYAGDSAIGGGFSNRIGDFSHYSFIGGGRQNEIVNTGDDACIAGGHGNRILYGSAYASIGGGVGNVVDQESGASLIAGGSQNHVGSGSLHSSICGGYRNSISNNAVCAVIAGGSQNSVGLSSSNALAAGYRAHATNAGAFVWADLTEADFSSDRNNQFKLRAGGGMYLEAGSSGLTPAALRVECTGATGVAIHANQTSSDSTAVLANRGTGDLIKGFSGPNANNLVFRVVNAGDVYAQSYNPLSDRNAKENFAAIDPAVVLEKIAAMPIGKWSFKGDAIRHVGPMAQDFHAAFGIGPDDRHIATVDADGVALAAIQGLNRKVEGSRQNAVAEIRELREANTVLRRELQELKQQVADLARKGDR